MVFWTKLAVTADDFHDLHGPTLFLDIDQVIVGSLDDFFDYKPRRNGIIHNWLPRESKISCFHGKPNPDELACVYWQNQAYYRGKEPSWFRENWVDLD